MAGVRLAEIFGVLSKQADEEVNAAEAEPVKLNETSGCWIYLTGLLGLDGGAGLVDPDLGGQGRG